MLTEIDRDNLTIKEEENIRVFLKNLCRIKKRINPNISEEYYDFNTEALILPLFKIIFKTITSCESSKLSLEFIKHSVIEGLDVEATEEDIQYINSIFNAVDCDEKELKEHAQNILKSYSKKKVSELSVELANACKNGESDNKISEKISDIQKEINNVQTQSSTLTSFNTIKKEYLQDLLERNNRPVYSFGDDSLDRLLSCSAAPGEITILGGSTSAGKSAYTLHLINNLINNNNPVIYLSLEMNKERTMDRLLCMRLKNYNLSDFKNIQGPESPSYIRINEELEKITNSNFYCSFEPFLNLNKLKSLITQYKERTKNEYCIVFIDLLTMVEDFKQSSKVNFATSYELAMDKLSILAKETNVHIFGLVQLNRASDNIKIMSLKDIDKVRPNLASFKNSSALVERSRNAITLFRPEYYIKRYLINSTISNSKAQEEAQSYSDSVGDVVEVQLLKSSDSEPGNSIYYKFEGSSFNFTPTAEPSTFQPNNVNIGNELDDFFSL